MKVHIKLLELTKMEPSESKEMDSKKRLISEELSPSLKKKKKRFKNQNKLKTKKGNKFLCSYGEHATT